MKSEVTLAILETDHLSPLLSDNFGGYGIMFEKLFEQQPAAFKSKIFNVVDGQYPQMDETFDAFLVTGSRADAFSADAWVLRLKTYLVERYQSGCKLLGICFGHQLIALALGGEVERAKQGWGVGVQPYDVKMHSSWMYPRQDEFNLLVSHQDQVTRLPPAAQLIAKNDFCPNAAFVIGKQVLCFQGHPEFTEAYSRALLSIRDEVYGEEVTARALETLNFPKKNHLHDGVLIGQWMMNFVVQTA